MWSRNIFSHKAVVAAVISAAAFVCQIFAATQDIVIVYPKPARSLAAVDSSFILGHIPERLGKEASNLIVRINGLDFPVHQSGGFLGWVPLTEGQFTFQVNCFRRKDAPKSQTSTSGRLADGSVTVSVPRPLKAVSEDSLAIVGDYRPPIGYVTLVAGEMLEVRFQGTPKCQAWFSIPGVTDSTPMAEMPPQHQAYWGEALFGVGAVPDSFMLRGLYSGYLAVPPTVTADNAPIVYHLAFSAHRQLKMPSAAVSKESNYRVTLNSKTYPFCVRFVDSTQVVRVGPEKGYTVIFQPKGVEALAVGAEGNWYRLRLSATQYGYVKQSSVERQPYGLLPPVSYLKSIRTFSYEDSAVVEFPLAGMHPFRVIEDDERTIRIQLFGVISDTDWIRYDFRDSLIAIASWDQPEERLYELRLRLTQDVWGYNCSYYGNAFRFTLKRPPRDVHDIKGKTIVIDPGHSADLGAVGPTGYTEAEANLALALGVKEILTLRGAKVVLTRSDMRNLTLDDRPAIAMKYHADIFVSIHNNAQPDGVNPYRNNGVSTYYYHPHSILLARKIQQQMIEQTGLPDYGLYFGNLHVDRPTQYPAVLVECAFIILPEQEALLKTDKFRREVAKAITTGIEEFLKEYNHGQ